MRIWGFGLEANIRCSTRPTLPPPRPPICNQESVILSFVFLQACLRCGDRPAKCAPKHWLGKSLVLIYDSSIKCKGGIKESLKSCGDYSLDIVGISRISGFLRSIWCRDFQPPLILSTISSSK